MNMLEGTAKDQGNRAIKASTPTLELNGSRKKKFEKRSFSLMAGPIPPPLLYGTRPLKKNFFVASLSETIGYYYYSLRFY